MNPLNLMQLKKTFEKNHPKIINFFNDVLGGGIPEGTIIEVTITKPGDKPRTANMKVNAEDVNLINGLK